MVEWRDGAGWAEPQEALIARRGRVQILGKGREVFEEWFGCRPLQERVIGHEIVVVGHFPAIHHVNVVRETHLRAMPIWLPFVSWIGVAACHYLDHPIPGQTF